jgi:hypothetical protein
MRLAAILGLAMLVFSISSRALRFALLTEKDPPEQQSSPQPSQTPSASTQPNTARARKTDSKPASSVAAKRRRKRDALSTSGSAPSKKVVRNGSTADPPIQLAPGPGQGQSSQQLQSTTQLLASADDNLKKIAGRQLNQNQQDSVKQIRVYIDQAKTAQAAGAVDRAHNLAVKAQLLSDDLARH